jgi:phage gp29-like protein
MLPPCEIEELKEMADDNRSATWSQNGTASDYANQVRLAPSIIDKLKADPALDAPGAPPNYGQWVIPHVMTLQGLVSTISKVYRMDDEALRSSLENARHMELDVGIRECLEARWRSSALLNWRLEPDDPHSDEQKSFCELFTKILQRCPRFMQMRETLLRATWYGRYAATFRYGWEQIGPHMYVCAKAWRPVHGDKLVFRLDDGHFDTDADQVGIRVGCSYGERIGGYERIEPTDRGLAYFLTPAERKLLAIHKHQVEDCAYEDPAAAGHIHGVGLRSRIYWEWFQKQETLRWLIEYLERSAFGLDLWFYPEGNDAAKQSMKAAAVERISNFRNQIFVPTPSDGSGNPYGLQHVETGMAGVQALQELIEKYFGHRIKRLILGQTLTSESEGGGLGSDGIARVHLGTFKDIVSYDSINVQETITADIVTPLKDWNFGHARHFGVRFVIETEDVDNDQRVAQAKQAYEMGARLSEAKVLAMVGMSVPTEGEVVLQKPGQSDEQQQPGGNMADQMKAALMQQLGGN